MYTKSLLKPLDIDNHTLTKNCSTCIVSTQIYILKHTGKRRYENKEVKNTIFTCLNLLVIGFELPVFQYTNQVVT